MKTRKFLGLVAMATLTTTSFAQDWQQGGNGLFPPPFSVANPVNQRLGTTANFPLRIITNDIQRMHINQQFGANFLGVPTPGYIGIGDDPTDVRSRLTITGTNNTFFGGGGYRSWMKTGVFNLENSDNLYVGLKSEGFNRSDAIFAWGDDGNGNELNNARFIFSGTGPVNGSCTNCPTNASGLNGREVFFRCNEYFS